MRHRHKPQGGAPVFEESLVINVRRGPWRNQFYPPECSLYNDYWIDKQGNRTIVRVYWNPGETLAKCIEFRAVEANEAITGVAFSEGEKLDKPYTQKGPCGGCFSLRADIGTGDTSVLVDNLGDLRKEGFHFAVWLSDGTKSCEIDPQIYNEGTVGEGGWGRGKRRLVGFLRCLTSRLGWGS